MFVNDHHTVIYLAFSGPQNIWPNVGVGLEKDFNNLAASIYPFMVD